jgi:DNA-binding transcriptional regulator PaaX
LLPEGWIGIRAAEEFFALRSMLEEPARAYVRSITAD